MAWIFHNHVLMDRIRRQLNLAIAVCVITLQPVTVFAHSFAGTPSSSTAISFDLPNRFDRNNVVLIGWSHIAWNGFVPSLIMADLDKIKEKLVIVTEDTPIRPVLACISATRGPEYAAMLIKARSMGVPIVGGEPPLPALEANLLPMADRDAEYTSGIEKLVRQGYKVLVIVGHNHLPGISQLLNDKQISHQSINTKVDEFSDRIIWGDKILGRKGDQLIHDDSDLKYYADIIDCPKLTCEEQGSSAAFCKAHGF